MDTPTTATDPASPPADPSPDTPPQPTTTPEVRFDPTAAIPPDAPSVWSPFQTLGDAAKAHGDARQGLTTRDQTIKEQRDRIAELEAQITDGGAGDDAPTQVDMSKFQEAVTDLYQTGETNAAHIEAIAGQTGLPPDIVGEFMSFLAERRRSFMASVSDQHEGVDMQALEAFLNSGKSGFDANAIAGFNALAARGNTVWVPEVWQAYSRFVEGGGSFVDGAGRRYGADSQYRGPSRERPQKGYASRQEYQADWSKAIKSNDEAQKAAVRKKLEESDTSDW